MPESLNEEDVARLLANPDGETRAEIAGKIAAQHQALSDGERKMAEDIFRVMVKDAEVRVRSALSRQLTATGGAGPYTFQAAPGSLPDACTLTSGGLLAGTAPASRTRLIRPA